MIDRHTYRHFAIDIYFNVWLSQRLFRILYCIFNRLQFVCDLRMSKEGGLSRSTYDFNVLIRKKLSAKVVIERGATSILKHSVINNPLNAKSLTLTLLTYNGLRCIMCQPCQISLMANKRATNVYNCNLCV